MTMQVTDLSRLVPAPIEPRGICGENVAEIGGQFSIVQLQALAAGGIFIESLFLRAQVPALVDNYLLNVDNNDLGLPLAPNINVGGTVILSRFTAGGDAAGTGGVPIPMPSGFEAINMPLGVFVPNQSFFSIQGPRVFIRLDVAMIYRELPSIEEVG